MSLIDVARRLRPLIEKAAQSLSESEALDGVELYPEWKGDGRRYEAGFRVRENGILYTVLQPHNSQQGWNPASAVSLFAKVLIPDPDQIYEWEQPDSTNPYMKGDKVTHNGKTWASDLDNNVWEPGVYGWTEITAAG